ncbi:Fatty acyl-CoA hydrolase precursor, medium chain, partial [Acromyrmex echinatior]
WNHGERDATKYGNIAVQVELVKHKVIGNEDCLYLNVYITKIESSKEHPVMVWIHGGAFIIDSGDAAWYDPDYVVQKDVVTLNYKLGVLGFLNLNNKVAAGNQGLINVILALKWIQKNILKFGPGNITIFGEITGGAITRCLARSPLSKSIVHELLNTKFLFLILF